MMCIPIASAQLWQTCRRNRRLLTRTSHEHAWGYAVHSFHTPIGDCSPSMTVTPVQKGDQTGGLTGVPQGLELWVEVVARCRGSGQRRPHSADQRRKWPARNIHRVSHTLDEREITGDPRDTLLQMYHGLSGRFQPQEVVSQLFRAGNS